MNAFVFIHLRDRIEGLNVVNALLFLHLCRCHVFLESTREFWLTKLPLFVSFYVAFQLVCCNLHLPDCWLAESTCVGLICLIHNTQSPLCVKSVLKNCFLNVKSMTFLVSYYFNFIKSLINPKNFVAIVLLIF